MSAITEETVEFNIEKDSKAIEDLIDRYMAKGSDSELCKMSYCLQKCSATMDSVVMTNKIMSRFNDRLKSVTTYTDSWKDELLAVMGRTSCVKKEFERADYHISSFISWEVKHADGDGKESFVCQYDGDNEGSGSYDWRIGSDAGYCDFPDLSSKDIEDEETWRSLGLTDIDAVVVLYAAMFDCSFS